MSSAYEDPTVFDFDLNFLSQSTIDNTELDPQSKADRLRRSVIFLKKKILFSHNAVARYKDARNHIQELETNQVQCKEQCKQHLIEIRNFIEKVARLENERQAAEIREREKNEIICELQNRITALQSVQNQLKVVVQNKNKIESTSAKVERNKGKDNAKKGLIRKDNEILLKENAKIISLEKENEKLRKENVRILILENEIENFCKKNTLVANSDNAKDHEIVRIQKFEKELETLRKENAKIPKLEKDIETFRKENAKIPKFEKEIEILRKENAKISKLEKEIEILRKENAEIPKLGKQNETVLKQNVKISNLEKDVQTLRIQNAKIEMVNKALSKEIVKIPKKGNEIETLLTHSISATKEKGKFQPKCGKLTRKYKSLPDTNSEWSENSESGNDIFEDSVLSPTPNDTIIAEKSPIADKYIAVPRDSDNDNSNEVVSVDTGRGSSLAYSDTDKGLQSPEYFLNGSPPNGETIENEVLLEERETATIPIVVHNENQNICKPKSASFRKIHSKISNSVNKNNVTTEVSNSLEIPDYVSLKKHTQGVQEKECLELNNSLRCESYTDMELENIFSTMRLNYNAVSPIPRTPTRPREIDSTSDFSEPSEKILRCLFLSDKSDQLLLKLKGFVYRHTKEYFAKTNPKLTLQSDSTLLESQCEGGRNSLNTNKSIDKLIACFEAILKSKHILTEHSMVNTNSNFEISDCVLPHDDNNLGYISNPSSPEKDTNILQDKQERNTSAQIMSSAMLQEENQKQFVRDNNSVSISNLSSPEKDTNILQDKQERNTSAQIMSSAMLQEENQKQFVRDNNSVSISNLSSPEKDTAILQVVQVENELIQCLPMSMDGNKKQKLHNHSVFDELATDNEISRVTDSVGCPCDSVEINQSPIKNSVGKKAKNKKITKLERLKKKLQPKYKIRRENTPAEKSRIKPKQLFTIAKKVPVNDTSTSLNDKDVYEKAVKIMTEINSQQSAKLTKSPPKHTKVLLSPRHMTYLEKDISSSVDNQESQNCSITTRSKRKFAELDNCTEIIKDPLVLSPCKMNSTTQAREDNNATTHKAKEDSESPDELPSRKRRRRSSNEPLTQYKRVLRSSIIHSKLSTEDDTELSKSKGESYEKSVEGPSANESDKQIVPKHENTLHCPQLDQHDNNVVGYGDLDVFSENIQPEKISAPVKELDKDPSVCHPKESILCCMIEKYGVETVRPFAKKIPDNTVKKICEKIELEITTIVELPLYDTKNAMNAFVADLQKLNYKHFIAGMMMYLTKPERKQELFGKVFSSPAPAMTKAEQILLYVITHLKTHWPSVDVVDAVLSNIEYTLFKLNRTPEFDVIESTSHFYALLCRYFGAKSRLRLFILDAMYCIQFKSVPLIKQCLEVWMHIIPLAHMGIAKSPMVTCLVYLLHFYKCDDRFNRVQEIRNILSRRYFYKITDWNETKILEMFNNSIKDLKDISIEKKMLRLALIILAKRHGPRWCQNHIIKNLLQPMIEKENVPSNVKEFCVSMIGPLMKPYPVDMKVHCEIAINQLTDILNNNPSPKMEEAAIMSMMFINRHDQHSINRTLLSRKMKPMSSELEKIIRDYVKARTLKIWKKNLTSMAR